MKIKYFVRTAKTAIIETGILTIPGAYYTLKLYNSNFVGSAIVNLQQLAAVFNDNSAIVNNSVDDQVVSMIEPPSAILESDGDILAEYHLDIDAIKSVAYAMASKDVRFYLNGLYFTDGRLIATDGHRIAIRYAKQIPENVNAIVPDYIVKILTKLRGNVVVTHYNNQTRFARPGEFDLLVQNIELYTRYPKVDQAIYKNEAIELTLPIDTVKALKKILALQKARCDKYPSVTLKNGMLVDRDWHDTAGDNYNFDTGYLIDAVQATGVTNAEVHNYGEYYQLQLRDENCFHLIMGMR